MAKCPFCDQEPCFGVGCEDLRWSPDQGDLFQYVFRVVKDERVRLGQWFTNEAMLEQLIRQDAKWTLKELVKGHRIDEGHIFGTINEVADLARAVWKRYRNTPGIR